MLDRFALRWLLLILVLMAAPVASRVKGDDLEDRVEAKRKIAEAERIKAAEQIRKDAAERMKELEGRLAEVRQWTQAQFELGERDIIDKPQYITPTLERWQKQRGRDIYQFLQFRDESRGAIESGRALNTLLERVGAAAHQHLQTRQIDPSRALPLYEPTQIDKIDGLILRHLVWQKNTLGFKASGRFNKDPIDVQWPAILKEKTWEDHRLAVEAARKQVLVELDSNPGLSPETDEQLRDAVSSLNAAFSSYRKDWIRRSNATGGVDGFKLLRLHEGQRHIEQLIAAVYQIVEATSYQDVVQGESFTGGDIEEFLSYMYMNNLKLAPAKANDRDAYGRVFDMMVRYYLDINAVVKLERYLEQEIGQLNQINREAIDVALGKTMSAADQAAIMIEELKYARALLNNPQ